MRPSPYRQPISVQQADPHEDPLSSTADFDLLPVFGLLWIVSVLQVARWFDRAGELGPTDGLAGTAIVLLPLLVREPLRVLFARLRRFAGRARADGIRKS